MVNVPVCASPDTPTSCEPAGSLLSTVIVPLYEPAAVGAKRIGKAVEVPGAISNG